MYTVYHMYTIHEVSCSPENVPLMWVWFFYYMSTAVKLNVIKNLNLKNYIDYERTYEHNIVCNATQIWLF